MRTPPHRRARVGRWCGSTRAPGSTDPTSDPRRRRSTFAGYSETQGGRECERGRHLAAQAALVVLAAVRAGCAAKRARYLRCSATNQIGQDGVSRSPPTAGCSTRCSAASGLHRYPRHRTGTTSGAWCGSSRCSPITRMRRCRGGAGGQRPDHDDARVLRGCARRDRHRSRVARRGRSCIPRCRAHPHASSSNSGCSRTHVCPTTR